MAIVDMAITNAAADLRVMAIVPQAWLLSKARLPGFSVCRIKDRLSRDFDAEMSGGNRDLMLNGYLSLGAGQWRALVARSS